MDKFEEWLGPNEHDHYDELTARRAWNAAIFAAERYMDEQCVIAHDIDKGLFVIANGFKKEIAALKTDSD